MTTVTQSKVLKCYILSFQGMIEWKDRKEKTNGVSG
ncbi:hypothetical protein ES703_25473 [subsurface metagenome]